MRISITKIISISLLAFLSACASPVPKIDVAASKLASIKSIVVVRPPPQKSYTMLNFGHPGMAFGLVGGVIAASDQKSKQEQLTTAYKAQGVNISNALADRIAASLSSVGFQVRIEDGPWVESENGYTIQFDQIKSDADGVLVVTQTNVGFVATVAPSDYLPTITVVATLLGKDRADQIYRGYHASGWAPKAKGWRVSAPKTTFPTFNNIMADTSASAATLQEAAAAIATTIRDDLRP